jgi:predicted GNAT family acetyltransferase
MNDNDLIVEREEGPTRGRYFIKLSPDAEAEMTFRKTDNNTIVVDHTGVPPAFEGRGIAAKLVHKMIEDARKDGFKINPVCSYVVAQFRRHPEWADLHA